MTNYRRAYSAGATYFFTVNLAKRQHNTLLIEHIDALRSAFRDVKKSRPFTIDAIVILPEHLHCLWTLPPDDTDYSTRWNLLKGHFSRAIKTGEYRSNSRIKRRERGIWQRRFWEHMIRDENDFQQHIDYIHWNPVKHHWVENVVDWQYSSFHKFIKLGHYPKQWGHNGRFELQAEKWE